MRESSPVHAFFATADPLIEEYSCKNNDWSDDGRTVLDLNIVTSGPERSERKRPIKLNTRRLGSKTGGVGSDVPKVLMVSRSKTSLLNMGDSSGEVLSVNSSSTKLGALSRNKINWFVVIALLGSITSL